MKGLFFLLAFVSFSTLSQDYERVDATIQLYPKRFNAPEEFSKFLTRDFFTEEEKVRAIYTWLIENVRYDPEEYKKFNYSFTNYRERNQKEEKTRAKIIERTLKEGVAVCEGYAFVFEKMCQLQGIENYVVQGDIKTHFEDIGRPFTKRHGWNAAKIEGTWYLFDATWGAGKYIGKFIKQPSYFFYKTAPEQLIKSHYPEMVEDSFLLEIISFDDFSKAPLVISSELLFKDILSPKGGTILSFSSMNEVYFEIRTAAPKEIQYAYGGTKESVQFSEKEGIVTFTVPVQIGQDSLLIYFDNQPVLGYKVE
ncbi:MAG: transglutaminase domain-containing protein [Flavobacteriaceae bacterium]